MLLTFVPPLLVFLQNDFTPRVGIGCRAATVLLYMVFRFLLILLWMWDLKTLGTQKESRTGGIAEGNGTLPIPLPSRGGEPASERSGRPEGNTVVKGKWKCLVEFCAVSTAFVAIGGTMMHIMDIYRNCLCSLQHPRLAQEG